MLVSSIAGGTKASDDDVCEAEVGADGVYSADGHGGAAAEVGEVDVEVCVGEPVRDLLSELVDAVAFTGVLAEELVGEVPREVVAGGAEADGRAGDWVGLGGRPEEQAQDDGKLVKKADDGLEEVAQLGEGELVVRGRHGRSCLAEVCADGGASVDLLVVLAGVARLSEPGDLDVDVALVETSCGAQLVQDIIVAVLGLDVVV